MEKGKNEFSKLEPKELIGAPLKVAADASRQVANSTVEFINRVEFDTSEKQKRSHDNV